MTKQITLDTLFGMTPQKPEAFPLAVAQTTALVPTQTVTLDEQIEVSNIDTCVIMNTNEFPSQRILVEGIDTEFMDTHICPNNIEDEETAEDWDETQPLNIPDPQVLAMLNKPIAMLKGLYTVVRMPTEERLTIRFEDLSKDRFERLTEILEAYMRDVDAKYCIHNNRGRSWKGTGHRIVSVPAGTPTGTPALTTAASARTLKFSPFPSSTLNIFKTIRKMRSDAYHNHCVVLERQEESFQNNINILPYAEVLDFDEEINDIDKKLDGANTAIREFQTTEEWAGLLQTLEPYGVAKYLREKVWSVEHCSVMSTDIALDTATVKRHIEEEYTKMFEEVDATKKRKIDEFEIKQMRTRTNLAEQAIESLRSEMNNMVQRVVASSQRQPEKVKADLERLRRKVVSIGLDQLEPTVTQIMEVFDKPERAMELFGRKNIAEAIDSRVDALVASLE